MFFEMLSIRDVHLNFKAVLQILFSNSYVNIIFTNSMIVLSCEFFENLSRLIHQKKLKKWLVQFHHELKYLFK